MPDGLYSKYVVTKDGQPVTDCFVLRYDIDPAAREALITYATAVRATNRELAEDLLAAVDRAEKDSEPAYSVYFVGPGCWHWQTRYVGQDVALVGQQGGAAASEEQAIEKAKLAVTEAARDATDVR